jgi:hypothetical protein
MKRHALGFAVIALVSGIASVGLVALLHRGGIWRGLRWDDKSSALVWSLCCAAALAAVAGGRLLTTSEGEPARRGHRAVATAAAGLGLVPSAVLAVVAGRDRDDPDVVSMSTGHYVGFAALGAVVGLVVVWVMLAVPAVGWPVLGWYGWAVALIAAVALDVPGPGILLVALVGPLVLAGMLAFAVARTGRSVTVAASAGVSGLLVLAAGRWLVAGYWVGAAEQNGSCRVVSGECQSTYLVYELLVIPVLVMVPVAVALAGAWLGHRRGGAGRALISQ